MSISVALKTTLAQRFDQGRNLDFASVCASFCDGDGDGDGDGGGSEFPLQGRLRFQSHVLPGFSPDDFHLEIHGVPDVDRALPIMHISFLTLAGTSGALPWWVTEKITHDTTGDGKALHRFLDLLNRRFWELLFLKSRLGDNPKYGFLSPHSSRLINDLSFAIVGLERQTGVRGTPGEASLLHKTMQHCWATGGGSASAETLAAFLSGAFGCPVEARGFQLMRLAVAHSSKLTLGKFGYLSKSGGVIGKKALVFGGLALQITLSEVELLDEYLPSSSGAQLKFLCEILAIFYSLSLPQVTLRVNYFSNNTFATLGRSKCRLGWGATLSSSRPCSQIIGLSAQVMSRQQKKANTE